VAVSDLIPAYFVYSPDFLMGLNDATHDQMHGFSCSVEVVCMVAKCLVLEVVINVLTSCTKLIHVLVDDCRFSVKSDSEPEEKSIVMEGNSA
jgi:hypothetical protein